MYHKPYILLILLIYTIFFKFLSLTHIKVHTSFYHSQENKQHAILFGPVPNLLDALGRNLDILGNDLQGTRSKAGVVDLSEL